MNNAKKTKVGRQARAKPVVKVAVKQGMRTDDSVVDRSKKREEKKGQSKDTFVRLGWTPRSTVKRRGVPVEVKVKMTNAR